MPVSTEPMPVNSVDAPQENCDRSRRGETPTREQVQHEQYEDGVLYSLTITPTAMAVSEEGEAGKVSTAKHTTSCAYTLFFNLVVITF